MRNILITGASSGLGAALARAYAAPGAALILWGRDTERLTATANACRRLGAAVITEAFDVREIEGSIARIRKIDQTAPLDLAIFNAGMGGPTPTDFSIEPAERAHDIATVNFTAAVTGASAVADPMGARRRGHIVLVGSINESFPLPMAPTYSGTKAGLRVFAEALGLQMKRHGVAVTLVSPGFIDTPMSRQVPGPKPFMVTADAAAAIIKRNVARRATRLVFPVQYALMRGLFTWLPRGLRHAILLRLKA